MRKLLLILLLAGSFPLRQAASARTKPAPVKGPAGVASAVPRKRGAKPLTGTYRASGGSVFKIQALGGGRLLIGFEGVYPYRTPTGMSANMGTAGGVATLAGDSAEFKPEATQDCVITLKFAGRRLVVNQRGTDSECGFGANVSAAGTYTKRSSRPPKFEQR